MNNSQQSAQSGSDVQERPNPWRWRRGENPYRYTAFGVLGLEEVPRTRRAFNDLVKRRVQRARLSEVRLFGRRLDESEIHGAEQRLQIPADRVFEELRTHRPHPVQLEVADLAVQLSELPMPPAPDPSRILINRALLARLALRPRDRSFDPLPELP